MKAKYELIANLSGKKIAIFNMDNTRTKTMSAWAKKDARDVWLYSKSTKSTFQAINIQADLQGVEFTCVYAKDKCLVKTAVLGEHQISNLIAAITGAVASGMSFAEACLAAGKIRTTEKVMQRIAGVNGSILINDTFNNNPEAAIAALDFLAKSKGKKYLVFQPMIELGKYAEVSHEKVARVAAEVCDTIYLTNHNFATSFATALVLTPKEIANDLKQKIKRGDIVLFKGKEAENVFNLLR